MAKFDDVLTTFAVANENAVLDYVVEFCTAYAWVKINIPKPSYLLIHIIDNIKFDLSEIDNKRISTYVSIHDKISEKEQLKFVEHLNSKIQECKKNSQLIPPPLLELIESDSIWDSKPLLDSLIKLYQSLSDSLQSNPDVEQKKTIIELLVKFESKLNQLSNSDDHSSVLHETLGTLLETGDLSTLLWFNTLNTDSEINYLNFEQVLQGYLQNMERTALGNADVLKFVLDKTPSTKHDILITKIAEIVDTGDPAKYQTILDILVANPSDYIDDLISTVISSCKTLSSEMEYPTFITLDETIIQLHKSLYPHQVENISQRAIELIQNRPLA